MELSEFSKIPNRKNTQMPLIELPDDFEPDFRKTYQIRGRTATIEVQYRGLSSKTSDMPSRRWHFKLYVGEELVTAAPYNHPFSDNRELDNEKVANNLMTFYQYVLDDLLLKSREEKLAQKEQNLLDDIVKRCRDHVFDEYYQGSDTTLLDYDVIHALMNDDGWDVILQMMIEPAKMYVFSYRSGQKKPVASVYVMVFKIPFRDF
jgi:hypothetical protein